MGEDYNMPDGLNVFSTIVSVFLMVLFVGCWVDGIGFSW